MDDEKLRLFSSSDEKLRHLFSIEVQVKFATKDCFQLKEQLINISEVFNFFFSLHLFPHQNVLPMLSFGVKTLLTKQCERIESIG